LIRIRADAALGGCNVPGESWYRCVVAKRKKKNWDDVLWAPFEEIDPPIGDDLPDALRGFGEGEKWLANSIYVVRVRMLQSTAPFGGVIHLTVVTHDHQPRHDWRELQRIKNEIVGEAVEAVEVFPSEDRLVDCSNAYHLFCLPQLATDDGCLPFGFTARAVTEGSPAGMGESDGIRQRDFRPELRPHDVLHPHAAGSRVVELGPNDTASGRCSEDGSAIVFRAGGETTHHLDGKPVKMSRGECLKGHHVVFVAAKPDVDDPREPLG
jgi:hypothetical protein